MILSIQQILDRARHRPAGYVEDIVSHSSVLGDQLLIEDSEYIRLRKKYRGRQPMPPLLADLLADYQAAIKPFIGVGFLTIPQKRYEARAAVCDQCDFWNATAFDNRGACEHPGRPCRKIQRWLNNEFCAAGKWKE
jgi:hypothetical protein